MRCPQCDSDNETDATFCDQCAARLSAPAGSAGKAPAVPDGDNAPCPACGGRVEDRGATGVCTDCGLELSAVEAPVQQASAPAGLAQSLSAAILARLKEGLPVEDAVTAALALHGLGEGMSGVPQAAPVPAAPEPEAAGSQRAGSCPVCRGSLAPGARKCGGCGLSMSSDGDVTCPKCGETADAADEEHGCGALLSLAAIEGRFDPSVLLVCARCKQMYSSPRQECGDCGGRLLPASGLRELFGRR